MAQGLAYHHRTFYLINTNLSISEKSPVWKVFLSHISVYYRTVVPIRWSADRHRSAAHWAPVRRRITQITKKVVELLKLLLNVIKNFKQPTFYILNLLRVCLYIAAEFRVPTCSSTMSDNQESDDHALVEFRGY